MLTIVASESVKLSLNHSLGHWFRSTVFPVVGMMVKTDPDDDDQELLCVGRKKTKQNKN